MSSQTQYKTKPTPRRYKGTAPAKLDLFLVWILSLIIGVLIFYVVYILSVGYIRSLSYYNILVEIGFVFIILAISDLIGYIIAIAIVFKAIHGIGYIRNKKYRKNRAFWFTEYSVATFLKAICFALGLVWILSGWLYYQLEAPHNNLSFFYAWLIISLGCKFVGWIGANVIFPN